VGCEVEGLGRRGTEKSERWEGGTLGMSWEVDECVLWCYRGVIAVYEASESQCS
jgi:hypothetical protein